MRTLLHLIDQYDREQRERIRELEEANAEKDAKLDELTNQLASYVSTVDRMKLDLILGGALQHPDKNAALSKRVADLEKALRFYADEDTRNGWGGIARAVLEATTEEVPDHG